MRTSVRRTTGQLMSYLAVISFTGLFVWGERGRCQELRFPHVRPHQYGHYQIIAGPRALSGATLPVTSHPGRHSAPTVGLPAHASNQSIDLPAVIPGHYLAPIVNRHGAPTPATHSNVGHRQHSTDWCEQCAAWTCADCGLQCECPPELAVPPPAHGPNMQTVPGAQPSWEGSPPGDVSQSPSDSLVPSPEVEPNDQSNLTLPPTNDGQLDMGGAQPNLSDFAQLSSQYGASSSLQGSPMMMGDAFGVGPSTAILREIIPTRIQAVGLTGTSLPGDPNGFISFEVTSSTASVADDFFSDGLGRDELGPAGADTFDITEPLPGSDAPTSPGTGYIFDGGQARNSTGTYVSGDIWDIEYSYSQTMAVVIPEPTSGGLVVGRLKIADNTSPLPRDRVFVDYSFFDNVPLVAQGTPVHRFTPGFERTYNGGRNSIELRAPLAATADSYLFVDGNVDRDVEFGNLFLAVKRLIAHSDRAAVSAGMAITLPTADDLTVALRNGTELARIEQDSVHCMPFLGWLVTPSDRLFAQGFVQLDIDLNGNRVAINQTGDGLVPVGKIQGTSFLYVDGGIGYWLRRNRFDRMISGIAPIAELHFNRSLQSSDTIASNGFQIGRGQQDIQQLNLLLGTILQLPRIQVGLGYTVPVGNGADQMFDGELRMTMNRFF